MDRHRIKTFRYKITLARLLVGAYFLALTGIVGVLNVESSKFRQPFLLTGGMVSAGVGGQQALVFSGEGLHEHVRGLYFASDVEEEPFLWKTLQGVPVRELAVSGNFALAACFQNKLISLDISLSTQPVIADSIEMPESIKHVVFENNRALVGMKNGGGLAVVDIDDTGGLMIVHHFPMTGAIVKMVADGQFVYYLDYEQGVGVIDLAADSPEPRLVANAHKPWLLAVGEGKLAVASIAGEVALFDQGSDGLLQKAGTLTLQPADRGGVRGLAFTSGTLTFALKGRGLKSFSTADWPRLVRFFDLELPGEPYVLKRVPGLESLLVSMVAGGIAKIDILLSGEGVLKGHLPLPTTLLAMAVKEKTLYASGQTNYGGIFAFHIDDIEKKYYDSATYVDQEYHSLLSWNGRLYGYRRDRTLFAYDSEGVAPDATHGRYLLAYDDDGAAIYELGADAEPVRRGSVVMQGKARGALQVDGAWFVLHENGIKAYAGDDFRGIVEVAELEIAGRPTCMSVLRPGVLLVSTHEGIMTLDVSDPAAISVIAETTLPMHLSSQTVSHSIVVVGDVVYVTEGNGGVYVLDISRPEKPELIQIVDTPGKARKMLAHDNLLYVADSDKGVFLIDITDKKKALPIGSLPMPLSVESIALVDDGLIVSSYPAGTVKMPLPRLIDSLELRSENEMYGRVDSFKSKGYAYLYDDSAYRRVPVKTNSQTF